MNHSHFLIFLLVFSFPFYLYAQTQKNGSSFLDNYQVTWGGDHVSYLNQGEVVQLSLDNHTGSGFASKLNYGSGFFNMSIKLPDNAYTAGLVIAFYLTSKSKNTNDTHDELDFELLGHTEGKPYLLQTNVFANGQGNREQRMSLWFDPTTDFHSYQFLWNPHHIV
uniref:Xyloglucan:xyloglucosyl transferase n=1 Tax=Opuntia streptacantha TaxID=393608 RepID=A0A7C9CL01_OPUST